MKTKIILTLMTCVTPLLTTWAQGSSEAIHAILQQIENNNKELQANNLQVASQIIENRSSNNLTNPQISYAHLWDSKNSRETVGEMVVSQGFDFPSLYITRGKLNRIKAQALDAEARTLRQQILLQAQELCLDIIMLHQQQLLLKERLTNAEELSALYKRRLETGDANILETNKINLELLNVRTEARANQTAIHGKMQELMTLNGNHPLNPGRALLEGQVPQPAALGLVEYPSVALPLDFKALSEELIQNDPSVQAALNQSQAAHKQVSVSKQGWLPSLELGYRRNTESGHPLNGVVVGVSVPIFENVGKVKAAKAQALRTDFQKENTSLQVRNNLWKLYEEAYSLQCSIKEYKDAFGQQQDLALLKKALEGGEISMIEYFVEVAVIYQSHNNMLQLENQYQKAMAQIYQSKL